MLPWSSIFSERVSATLHTIESWISSIFFFLFLITVGPWFIFLAYDLLLYLFRTITYEIPIVGGRARGKERPRAPSLKERATGEPRVPPIGVPAATFVDQEDVEEEEKRMSGQQTPDQEHDAEKARPTPPSEQSRVLADMGFSQQQEDDDVEDGVPTQRVFSISGSDERESWTEVNARRRMGFKDDEGAA